jgi:hypothetical protein
MALIHQLEQPIIVVGTAATGWIRPEVDGLARLLMEQGQSVVRYSGLWPRNEFYSEPQKLFLAEDTGKDSKKILGMHQLFLSDGETMVFSQHVLKFMSYQRLNSLVSSYLGERELIFFNTIQRKFFIPRYPNMNTYGTALPDIDYVLNWLPEQKVLVTYDIFRDFNKESIPRLKNVGYSQVITLPEEEFPLFPVNFEVFYNKGREFIVINSACKRSIEKLRAEGIEVLPSPIPLAYLRETNIAGVGGSVRCCTNKLYSGSAIPPELASKIIESK